MQKDSLNDGVWITKNTNCKVYVNLDIDRISSSRKFRNILDECNYNISQFKIEGNSICLPA